MWLFNDKVKLEQDDSKENGLCVSLDSLIAQQRFLPYLGHNNFTSNMAGDVRSVFKGRGMELEEVREYNFGDDIRDIDWRVTARKQEPFTKIFNEEKDCKITVFLDLSASMVFGTRHELKSVTASKIAALIGWMAIKNRDRFGALIYDGKNMSYFKPKSNYQSLLAIFKKISQTSEQILHNEYLGKMSDALNVLQYNNQGKGTIFIVSDFNDINHNELKKIVALSKNNKIYCIQIYDLMEEVAPPTDVYAAQYKNMKVVFDTGNKEFRKAYTKHFNDERNEFKQNCQKFSFKYAKIRTDLPISDQLKLS